MRTTAVVVAIVLSMSAPFACAFELQQAEARFADEQYQFDMTALLDATPPAVERILRSYESYPELDERIIDARVIERPSNQVAVLATTVRACIGPVCRNVKRVERVEEVDFGLVAITDVSRSDMKFGETRMRLALTEDGRTRVTYQTRMTPDFWIPALVARKRMLRTLEDATIELFMNIERRASEQPTHE